MAEEFEVLNAKINIDIDTNLDDSLKSLQKLQKQLESQGISVDIDISGGFEEQIAALKELTGELGAELNSLSDSEPFNNIEQNTVKATKSISSFVEALKTSFNPYETFESANRNIANVYDRYVIAPLTKTIDVLDDFGDRATESYDEETKLLTKRTKVYKESGEIITEYYNSTGNIVRTLVRDLNGDTDKLLDEVKNKLSDVSKTAKGMSSIKFAKMGEFDYKFLAISQDQSKYIEDSIKDLTTDINRLFDKGFDSEDLAQFDDTLVDSIRNNIASTVASLKRSHIGESIPRSIEDDIIGYGGFSEDALKKLTSDAGKKVASSLGRDMLGVLSQDFSSLIDKAKQLFTQLKTYLSTLDVFKGLTESGRLSYDALLGHSFLIDIDTQTRSLFTNLKSFLDKLNPFKEITKEAEAAEDSVERTPRSLITKINATMVTSSNDAVYEASRLQRALDTVSREYGTSYNNISTLMDKMSNIKNTQDNVVGITASIRDFQKQTVIATNDEDEFTISLTNTSEKVNRLKDDIDKMRISNKNLVNEISKDQIGRGFMLLSGAKGIGETSAALKQLVYGVKEVNTPLSNMLDKLTSGFKVLGFEIGGIKLNEAKSQFAKFAEELATTMTYTSSTVAEEITKVNKTLKELGMDNENLIRFKDSTSRLTNEWKKLSSATASNAIIPEHQLIATSKQLGLVEQQFKELKNRLDDLPDAAKADFNILEKELADQERAIQQVIIAYRGQQKEIANAARVSAMLKLPNALLKGATKSISMITSVANTTVSAIGNASAKLGNLFNTSKSTQASFSRSAIQYNGQVKDSINASELAMNSFNATIETAKTIYKIHQLLSGFTALSLTLRGIGIVARSLTGVINNFIDTFIIDPLRDQIYNLGRAFYDLNDTVQNTKLTIENMLSDVDSTEGMKDIVDGWDAYILEIAKKTPFTYVEANNAAMKLAAQGLDPTIWMAPLTNLAAASGKLPLEDAIKQATRALTQLVVGNTGEAVEAFRDLNVNVAMISATMDNSTGKFIKQKDVLSKYSAEVNQAGLAQASQNKQLEYLISKGLISKTSLEFEKSGKLATEPAKALDILNIYLQENARFAGAAESASKSLTGRLSTLSDTMSKLMLIIGQPVFDSFATFIARLTSKIEAATPLLTYFANIIADYLVDSIDKLTLSLENPNSMLSRLADTIITVMAAISSSIRGDGTKAWDLWYSVLSDVVDGAFYLFDNLISRAFDWGFDLIGMVVNGINKAIKSLLWDSLDEVGETISDYLEPHSPPKEGPLSTIDKWGPDLMGVYVSSFADVDYTTLTKLADTVSSAFDLNTDEGIASFGEFKTLLTEITEEAISTGSVNQDTFSKLRELLGDDNELLTNLVASSIEYQAAQSEVSGIEQAILKAKINGEDTTELEKQLDIAKSKLKIAEKETSQLEEQAEYYASQTDKTSTSTTEDTTTYEGEKAALDKKYSLGLVTEEEYLNDMASLQQKYSDEAFENQDYDLAVSLHEQSQAILDELQVRADEEAAIKEAERKSEQDAAKQLRAEEAAANKAAREAEKEAKKKTAEQIYQEALRILDQQLSDGIISQEDYASDRLKIEQDYYDATVEEGKIANAENIQNIRDYQAKLEELKDNQRKSNKKDAEADAKAEIDILDLKLKAGIIDEEEYAKKRFDISNDLLESTIKNEGSSVKANKERIASSIAESQLWKEKVEEYNSDNLSDAEKKYKLEMAAFKQKSDFLNLSAKESAKQRLVIETNYVNSVLKEAAKSGADISVVNESLKDNYDTINKLRTELKESGEDPISLPELKTPEQIFGQFAKFKSDMGNAAKEAGENFNDKLNKATGTTGQTLVDKIKNGVLSRLPKSLEEIQTLLKKFDFWGPIKFFALPALDGLIYFRDNIIPPLVEKLDQLKKALSDLYNSTAGKLFQSMLAQFGFIENTKEILTFSESIRGLAAGISMLLVPSLLALTPVAMAGLLQLLSEMKVAKTVDAVTTVVDIADGVDDLADAAVKAGPKVSGLSKKTFTEFIEKLSKMSAEIGIASSNLVGTFSKEKGMAVGGFFTTLGTKLSTIPTALAGFIPSLTTFFTVTLPGFITAVAPVIATVVGWGALILGVLFVMGYGVHSNLQYLANIWDDFVTKLTFIKDKITELISGLFAPIIPAVTTVSEKVEETSTLFERLKNDLSLLLDPIRTGMGGMFTAIYSVVSILLGLAEVVIGVFYIISGKVTDGKSIVEKGFLDISTSIGAFISGLGNMILSLLKEAFLLPTTVSIMILDAIGLGDVANLARTGRDNLIGALDYIMSDLPEYMYQLFTGQTSFTEMLSSILDDMRKGFTDIIMKDGSPIMVVFSALGISKDDIIGTINLVLDSIKKAIHTSGLDTAVEELKAAWDKLFVALNESWDMIKTEVIPIFEILKKSLLEAISPLTNWIKEHVTLQSVLAALKPVLILIATVIGVVIVSAIALAVGVISAFVEAITTFVTGMKNIILGISEFIEGIKKSWSGILTILKGIFTGDLKEIKKGFDTWLSGLDDMFTGIWDIMVGTFESSLGTVLAGLNGFIEGAGSFLIELYNSFSGNKKKMDKIEPIDVKIKTPTGTKSLTEADDSGWFDWFMSDTDKTSIDKKISSTNSSISSISDSLYGVQMKTKESTLDMSNTWGTYNFDLTNKNQSTLANLSLGWQNFGTETKATNNDMLSNMSLGWQNFGTSTKLTGADAFGDVKSQLDALGIKTGDVSSGMQADFGTSYSGISSESGTATDKLATNFNLVRVNQTILTTAVLDLWTTMYNSIYTKSTEMITKLGSLRFLYESAGSVLANGFYDGFKSVWESMMLWLTDEIESLSSKFTVTISGVQNKTTNLPSHASGAWNIPYDGYVAQLHQGESVLPAGAADAFRSLVTSLQNNGIGSNLTNFNITTQTPSYTTEGSSNNITISVSNYVTGSVDNSTLNKLASSTKIGVLEGLRSRGMA